jgi:formylglycine-generating enzyme
MRGKAAPAAALLAALAASPAAARRCPGDMARLPAGRYRMAEREGYEPKIAAFCIDRTEVTVAAYAACAARGACTPAAATISHPGATPAEVEEWSRWCNRDRADRRDHPVNCVDWRQADAFCRAAGKRLPSEEEWEWAAHGARPTATYPWGEASPRGRVCWNEDGHGRPAGPRGTCPVGSHPEGDSPQGVKDLGGNVWEWTASFNRDGPERVSRGGGWYYTSPKTVSAEYRQWQVPELRSATLGFRCARSP